MRPDTEATEARDAPEAAAAPSAAQTSPTSSVHPAARRRDLLALAAAPLLAGSVRAQPAGGTAAWPTRAVRLVVPFNAGGATDIVARAVADALARRTGQAFVVDNRGGAGGILGTDAVAKAAPDGATLLLSLSTSMLINQFLYTRLPYDPQKDLALLTQVASAPVTLVVHPSVPARNMQELLAWVKANRGKVSYGSYGVGSYAHLAGAYMSKTQDADMAHVAYKGEAPMIQDVVGGQVQLAFSSAQNTRPFIEAGRLRAIGVTGRERMAVLPAVPTIREQGVTDEAYTIVGWVGMAGPAGLPRPLADAIAAQLRDIAHDAKLLERIAAAGFIPLMNGPEAFRENYRRDLPVWKALVDAAGARLD